MPNQTPEEALRLIRTHLDANGFADLEIRKLGGYAPAQTSVNSPMICAERVSGARGEARLEDRGLKEQEKFFVDLLYALSAP